MNIRIIESVSVIRGRESKNKGAEEESLKE